MNFTYKSILDKLLLTCYFKQLLFIIYNIDKNKFDDFVLQNSFTEKIDSKEFRS